MPLLLRNFDGKIRITIRIIIIIIGIRTVGGGTCGFASAAWGPVGPCQGDDGVRQVGQPNAVQPPPPLPFTAPEGTAREGEEGAVLVFFFVFGSTTTAAAAAAGAFAFL